MSIATIVKFQFYIILKLTGVTQARNNECLLFSTFAKWIPGLVPRVSKKKDAPGHLLIKQTKKIVLKCFHWKYFEDFKFSFNLDQSQVCISNRLKVTASQRQLLFWAHDKIQNHKWNCLLFLYLMKLLKTNFQPFFSQSNFKDFQIFFHYRPIPSLYLKRLKSYSSSEWNTDYLEFFVSYGIVKTIHDCFYSFFYYAQTPQD